MKAWLFLFVMVLSTVPLAACCLQDSITIDGVPLVLDLDVRQSNGDSKNDDAKVKSGMVKPTVFFGASVMGWRQMADAAGVPLSQVTGSPIQPAVAAVMGSIFRSETKQWKLQAEWGSFRCLTMDLFNVDDSAFAIAPNGQGGAEQWVQRTYDLGVELDTLPLTLEARAMQMGSLSFSMGSRAQRRESKTWGLWGGVSVKWFRLIRSTTEVERIPEFGMPAGPNQQGEARLDWVPHQTWSLGAHFCAEHRFNSRWSTWLRGEWNVGLRSHWGFGLGLSHRLVR